MFASSAANTIVVDMALSLDALKDHLLDVYDRMQRDWWATAYWGGVWACGFVATFLLLRMLFTHWGDRDVMKKTLGLSLLVHVLVGMLSTTVIFGPGTSASGEPEALVAIRRIVSGDLPSPGEGPPSNEDLPGDNRGRLPGKAPAWERPAAVDPQAQTRLEMRPQGSADAEITPDQRPAGDANLPLAVPDVAASGDRPDQTPEPDRQTSKITRPVEAPQSPIAEETAEARPDLNTRPGGPARGARGAPGLSIGEAVRNPRSKPAAVISGIENGPDLVEAGKTSDPGAVVPRGEVTREPLRMSRGNPQSTPVDEGAPGATAAPADVGGTGGPGSSGRPVARIGRSPRTPGASDTGGIERTRLADGSPGAGADGSSSTAGGIPGGAIASRSGGDPEGMGLSPSLIRSEFDGAIGKGGGKVPAAYRLRTSPARKKIAIEMGANEESERAVETSLQWLANRQHPEGFWDPIESTLGQEPDPTVKFSNPQERERSGFNSESGLTALAVLAFLGKGYTHEDNPFSETVDRALRWLIAQQDAQGFLGGKANPYARMYCHGMATIAIGEAYGMTKDQSLREPLVRAVKYIVDSQNTDGGWRYFKGKQGDMSMFGWQLMALKSARTAGLAVPVDSMNRAIDFLIAHGDALKNRKLSQFGGLAAYRIDEAPKPSMTAESLFCKQILGIKRTNRAAVEAVEFLQKNLPQRSRQDLYYWYYGTLAMYHHGGDPWRRWNQALRDNLVADQRTDGDFAGSWNPRAPWGDYGGRVFSTAVSTLCLEVYYRFLPLYQTEDAERLEQGAK